jgi:hypothetical protein
VETNSHKVVSLTTARQAAGYRTIRAFTEAFGLDLRATRVLESGELAPMRRGSWRPEAALVAEALDVFPEQLWPGAVEGWERRYVDTESFAPSPADLFDATDLNRQVHRLLSGLDWDFEERRTQQKKSRIRPEDEPLRRADVIRLRFGIGECTDRCLWEVGELLGGRTAENIRQRETQALRLLRHPSRSKLLRTFVDPTFVGDVPPKPEDLDLRQDMYGHPVDRVLPPALPLPKPVNWIAESPDRPDVLGMMAEEAKPKRVPRPYKPRPSPPPKPRVFPWERARQPIEAALAEWLTNLKHPDTDLNEMAFAKLVVAYVATFVDKSSLVKDSFVQRLADSHCLDCGRRLAVCRCLLEAARRIG